MESSPVERCFDDPLYDAPIPADATTGKHTSVSVCMMLSYPLFLCEVAISLHTAADWPRNALGSVCTNRGSYIPVMLLPLCYRVTEVAPP